MADPWHAQPGDTPLTDVPADYYPAGCGAWFEIPAGRDAGKRVFVRDSVHGDGSPDGTDGRSAGPPADHTIVLVHGNPESSYTYRNVISALLARTDRRVRVVTMDHVGFGLSDTADYEMVCQDHARNLDQLIAALDLHDVTLVIHDWGGPIGIGAFLRHADRVSNLVITNSAVFPVPDDGLTFRNYPSKLLPWPRVPDVIPDALWGELAAYAVFRTPCHPARLYAGLAWYATMRRLGWVPDDAPEAHRVYSQQFRDAGNVAASKRLVRQTPYWAEGNAFEDPAVGRRDTTEFYAEIQDRLGPTWGPDGSDIGVRAVVGRWDPTAKPSAMDRWRAALPQLAGNVTAFDDVGHFVEEAQPGAVADAIATVIGR